MHSLCNIAQPFEFEFGFGFEFGYIRNMDPIAQRIADLIEEKGYSRSGFAEAVGVQRTIVSHVLSGRNRPSLDLVVRILRTFPELDPSGFILGEQREVNEEQEGAETEADENPKTEEEVESGQKEIPLSESAQAIEEKGQEREAKDEDPPAYRTASRQGANKAVERVVICYSDGTFASYEADV